MDDDAIERLLVDHPELEPHADVLRDHGQRAAHAGACRLAAAQDVRCIEHAAKHAADLSVDLVTIAGQQMHRPGPVDIRCMASVVAGTLRERGDGATVEVTLAHPGVVVVDRGQVERALVILAGLGRGRARRVLLSAGPSGDDAARPSIRVDIAGSTPLALGRGSSDAAAQHLALAVARGLVGRNGGRIVGPRRHRSACASTCCSRGHNRRELLQTARFRRVGRGFCSSRTMTSSAMSSRGCSGRVTMMSSRRAMASRPWRPPWVGKASTS